MTRAIKAKINIIFSTRILLAVILVVSAFYAYSICLTIRAAVQNREGIKNLELLNQKYQVLESQYFNLLGKIDIDYAYQLGFIDQAQKTNYLVRQSSFARR